MLYLLHQQGLTYPCTHAYLAQRAHSLPSEQVCGKGHLPMPKEHVFLSHNHRTGQVVANAKGHDVVVEGVHIIWSDAKATQG